MNFDLGSVDQIDPEVPMQDEPMQHTGILPDEDQTQVDHQDEAPKVEAPNEEILKVGALQEEAMTVTAQVQEAMIVNHMALECEVLNVEVLRCAVLRCAVLNVTARKCEALKIDVQRAEVILIADRLVDRTAIATHDPTTNEDVPMHEDLATEGVMMNAASVDETEN